MNSELEDGRGLRQPALVNHAPAGRGPTGFDPARDPVRIQLSRKKGWRLPENTVKVSRPGLWGNPFVVTDKMLPGKGVGGSYIAVPTVADAVARYREMLTLGGETAEALRSRLPELRGKNLACWCPLDQPCHADVLLEMANRDSRSKPDRAEPVPVSVHESDGAGTAIARKEVP